jgi:hypothetical protein
VAKSDVTRVNFHIGRARMLIDALRDREALKSFHGDNTLLTSLRVISNELRAAADSTGCPPLAPPVLSGSALA